MPEPKCAKPVTEIVIPPPEPKAPKVTSFLVNANTGATTEINPSTDTTALTKPVEDSPKPEIKVDTAAVTPTAKPSEVKVTKG